MKDDRVFSDATSFTVVVLLYLVLFVKEDEMTFVFNLFAYPFLAGIILVISLILFYFIHEHLVPYVKSWMSYGSETTQKIKKVLFWAMIIVSFAYTGSQDKRIEAAIKVLCAWVAASILNGIISLIIYLCKKKRTNNESSKIE